MTISGIFERLERAGPGDRASLVRAFRGEIAAWRAHGDDCGNRLVAAEPAP